MIEIEIDGKKLTAEPGSMLIQVADEAGIKIPRFCYHKKLSVAANCRMCLVDVEKSAKPLPACATPVMQGMVVRTRSQLAIDAQKAVMEFLLINHPLDCPICDQGGQCELQDISMGYGKSISRYEEGKRSVHDKDIGSLVATDMTRCIQCTRCVRFGSEIAGLREMGGTGRGEHLEIGTYIEKSLVSEVSGNIIDLCPVGALTSKPFRFRARAWELIQAPSIAAHDCLGSNISIHRLRQKVMRVVPRENEAVNETWLSDRDRFSYEGLYSADRLTQPMIKVDGQWQEVEWEVALEFTVTHLKKIIDSVGATQIGGIASPNNTLEELYLFQKWLRDIGTNHIDHRLHQSDFSDGPLGEGFPGLGIKLADLEQQDVILLIGSDIPREQPLAGLRIRKAALKNKTVLAVNCIDYAYHFPVKQKCIVHPGQLLQTLAGIAKALLKIKPLAKAHEFLASVTPRVEHEEMARELLTGEKKVLILGAMAQNHPQAALIHNLATLIAQLTGAVLGTLTEGANASGAWLAGVVPHRLAGNKPSGKAGFDIHRQWLAQLKAYVLFNIEPELDCEHPSMVMQALHKAEFVVGVTPFKGNALDYAHVLLPCAPFAETAGTFVNTEGRWQSFSAATTPVGESRPAWKIWRVLGNLFSLEGYQYMHTEEVRHELKELIEHSPLKEEIEWVAPANLPESSDKLVRMTEWPIYRIDNLVRRSTPLQESGAARPLSVRISPALAARLHAEAGQLWMVSQDGIKVNLTLEIDAAIPDNVVMVPAGYPETATLGGAYGAILLERSV